MKRDPATVRKPPTDARFALHLPQTRGKCRWCGLPVEKPAIYWHADCEREFLVIIRPEVARRAVEKRDRGICAECGEDWSERFAPRKAGIISIGYLHDASREEFRAEYALGYWQYTEITWVSLWHVDHKVPLWKVAHMPDLARLDYFMLANMVTLCHRCHGRKTAKEAADRAKFDEMAAKPEKPKSKWPKGRKLQSRRFQQRKKP